MSKIILTLDSTQIDAYLTCPQYWAYRHKDHLIPIGKSSEASDSMLMGTFGHRLLEVYYKAAAFGFGREDSVQLVRIHNPDIDKCECGHYTDQHKLSDGETECLVCKDDCESWRPKLFELDPAKREVVRRRVLEYLMVQPIKGDIIPASVESIEAGFSELIYEDAERMYILEGRIDMADCEINGQRCIVDHKFQLRRKDLYKKAIQFRNYAMVCHSNMMVVNYIRLAAAVDKQTFERVTSTFTEAEHCMWRLRLTDIYHAIYEAQTLRAGRYTKNESACTNKYGYECEYTHLCEEWEPNMVHAKRETMYSIGEAWRPW